MQKTSRNRAVKREKNSAQSKTEIPKESPKERRTLPKAVQVLGAFAVPVFCFYLAEALDRNPFEQIRPQAMFFNILLLELLFWLFFFVTGRLKYSARILIVLYGIFMLINHYVTSLRSTPFVPWDIFSVKTAASVAGEYDFSLSLRQIALLAALVFLLVLAHLLTLRIPGILKCPWKNALLLRTLPSLLLAAVFVLFGTRLQQESFQTAHKLYPYLYTPGVMVKYNGQLVTFVMDCRYLLVSRPSGYDREEAKQLLAEYESEEEEEKERAEEEQRVYPNIIVIMDEAFSDLSVLGDFTVSEDEMPFVHGLLDGAENTRSGYMYVSVCGGDTADTEWEFLTGNSMANLPAGSIPYQQYIREETPSLASHLSSLGYETAAVHPYNASGWNRNKVYPLLGIDSFYSLKDFISPSYLRNYVDDQSSFAKVIKLYEQKQPGVPIFIFNVTMQNHGGYTEEYENFTPQITAYGIDSLALSQYLSLLRQTDAALSDLIGYFAGETEPTMIIFFGDHQPSDAVTYQIQYQNGADYRSLTEEQLRLRYIVPFVIWANFDIEEASGEVTSANFLAAEALEAAGVPLSGYQRYLLTLKEDYPVISSVWTDGDLEGEALAQYSRLQYYLMFDRKE